jgi:hypothetical protein
MQVDGEDLMAAEPPVALVDLRPSCKPNMSINAAAHS